MMKLPKQLIAMLLMLVTSMAFVSCSDDDDNEGPAHAELIGSWQTFSTYTNDVVVMQVAILFTFNEDFTATERAVIRTNNETTMDRTLSFTYEFDGTTLKLKNDNTGIERTSRIMITNDKLVQIDDESSSITVYSRYTPNENSSSSN